MGLSNAPFLVIKETKDSHEQAKTSSFAPFLLFFRFLPSAFLFSCSLPVLVLAFLGLFLFFDVQTAFGFRCCPLVGLSNAPFLVIKETKDSHEQAKTSSFAPFLLFFRFFAVCAPLLLPSCFGLSFFGSLSFL